MGLIRLVVFGFLGLSVVYLLISIYSRSIRREKLEKRWAEENPGVEDETARDLYVDKGMVEYQNGIRPKLILLVYVIPTILVVIILILTNSN